MHIVENPRIEARMVTETGVVSNLALRFQTFDQAKAFVDKRRDRHPKDHYVIYNVTPLFDSRDT